MRSRLLTLLAFLFIATYLSKAQGNYIMIINGDSISIDLDKPFEFTTKSGVKLDINLVQPNTLTYTDDMISFKYPKSSSISNNDLGDGISQLMLVKSTGNGFMLQKYTTMDPSSLTVFMLSELIKESISYGYTKEEKPFKKELKSGQTIEGIEATLTYNGEKEVYVVATYGTKDAGIIVVTMLLSEDFKDTDQPLIDLFLDTLILK